MLGMTKARSRLCFHQIGCNHYSVHRTFLMQSVASMRPHHARVISFYFSLSKFSIPSRLPSSRADGFLDFMHIYKDSISESDVSKNYSNPSNHKRLNLSERSSKQSFAMQPLNLISLLTVCPCVIGLAIIWRVEDIQGWVLDYA